MDETELILQTKEVLEKSGVWVKGSDTLLVSTDGFNDEMGVLMRFESRWVIFLWVPWYYYVPDEVNLVDFCRAFLRCRPQVEGQDGVVPRDVTAKYGVELANHKERHRIFSILRPNCRTLRKQLITRGLVVHPKGPRGLLVLEAEEREPRHRVALFLLPPASFWRVRTAGGASYCHGQRLTDFCVEYLSHPQCLQKHIPEELVERYALRLEAKGP